MFRAYQVITYFIHPQRSQQADKSFKTTSSRTGFVETQNGMWKNGLVKFDGSVGS